MRCQKKKKDPCPLHGVSRKTKNAHPEEKGERVVQFRGGGQEFK